MGLDLGRPVGLLFAITAGHQFIHKKMRIADPISKYVYIYSYMCEKGKRRKTPRNENNKGGKSDDATCWSTVCIDVTYIRA